jgi:hypothetical protein
MTSRQNEPGIIREAAMAARKKLATRALWKMRRPRRPAIAASEKPATWAQWKARHPRWTRLTGIEWALEWLVYRCRNLAIFEVLEFAGRASVLIALLVWLWEADDRKKQSHYRAWELINSARGAIGDGGRRDALQDLHKDKVELAAAQLAKAYLNGVQLPNARLSGADLSGADLSEANLSGADLSWANLAGAKLFKANLTKADLFKADLTKTELFWTNLSGADLSWAKLTRADLFSVNLSGATNLSRAALENAKVCQTIMPDGTMNNRDCPPGLARPNPSEPPPIPGEETSAPE